MLAQFLIVAGFTQAATTGVSLDSWSRWDSFHYLSIARGGYQWFPCDQPPPNLNIWAKQAFAQSWWRGVPAKSCGNTAWFPGYSALIYVLARFAVPELLAGVLLSAVFALLTLILLWTVFLRSEPSARNCLCVLLAALFPGAVYYYAVYPISMVVFFILLSLRYAIREEWANSGIAGAVAAATYPVGPFLVLVAGIWIAYAARQVSFRERLKRIITFGMLTSAGLVSVFAVQRWYTGAWDVFFRMQGQYKSPIRYAGFEYQGGIHSPIVPLMHFTAALLQTSWRHAGVTEIAHASIPAATVFTAILVILLVAYGIRGEHRSSVDVYFLIFLVVFWLMPLMLGDFSLIRRHALLVPTVPLARHLPLPTLAVIVTFAVLLAPFTAMVFFNGVLF